MDNYDSPYRGPEVTPERIDHTEKCLGYRIPEAYLDLLRDKNGGSTVYHHVRTDTETFYGGNTLPLLCLMGIGAGFGLDTIDPDLPEIHSYYGLPLVRQRVIDRGYPYDGFVFSVGGHADYLLDYSPCGPQGEPEIIYIDWEYPTIRTMVVARDFATFLQMIEKTDL